MYSQYRRVMLISRRRKLQSQVRGDAMKADYINVVSSSTHRPSATCLTEIKNSVQLTEYGYRFTGLWYSEQFHVNFGSHLKDLSLPLTSA